MKLKFRYVSNKEQKKTNEKQESKGFLIAAAFTLHRRRLNESWFTYPY